MNPERFNNPKPTIGSWLKLKDEEWVRLTDQVKDGSADLDQEARGLRDDGYLPLGLYLEPEPGVENHEDMVYLRMINGMLLYASMVNKQQKEHYSQSHTYVVEGLDEGKRDVISIWVEKSADLSEAIRNIDNDVWTVNGFLEKAHQAKITQFPRSQLQEWVKKRDLDK